MRGPWKGCARQVSEEIRTKERWTDRYQKKKGTRKECVRHKGKVYRKERWTDRYAKKGTRERGRWTDVHKEKDKGLRR